MGADPCADVGEARVLEDLYDEYRNSPRAPDLDRLWAQLGVPDDPKTQPFDDHAPLAAIRVAITAPPSARAESQSSDGS